MIWVCRIWLSTCCIYTENGKCCSSSSTGRAASNILGTFRKTLYLANKHLTPMLPLNLRLHLQCMLLTSKLWMPLTQRVCWRQMLNRRLLQSSLGTRWLHHSRTNRRFLLGRLLCAKAILRISKFRMNSPTAQAVWLCQIIEDPTRFWSLIK